MQKQNYLFSIKIFRYTNFPEDLASCETGFAKIVATSRQHAEKIYSERYGLTRKDCKRHPNEVFRVVNQGPTNSPIAKMHQEGDEVVSQFGTTKGERFIIKKELAPGRYSCVRQDESDSKRYEFTDGTIRGYRK
jgi:hypothetical protein